MNYLLDSHLHWTNEIFRQAMFKLDLREISAGNKGIQQRTLLQNSH